MNYRNKKYLFTLVGVVMLAVGLFMVKASQNPQGIMKAIPYILVGFGCGIFGHGFGEIISEKAMKNSPDIQKQLDIDKNDERNVEIANRSKAKAYDMMVSVFGALMVAFALMQVDMVVILMFVTAYLFVVGCGLFYRFKYDKEM